MQLTAAERAALHNALVDAFIDYDDLSLMVMRAGRNLEDIVARGPMPTVAMRLIRFSETRDWVHELIQSARSANDTNQQLLAVAAAIGLEPAGVDVSEDRRDSALDDVSGRLERIFDAGAGLVDAQTYAAALRRIARQVCLVQVRGGSSTSNTSSCTGFLIGPQTVLTAYSGVMPAPSLSHGVMPAPSLSHEDVTLTFDFTRLRDGTTVNPGETVPLAADWLVDAAAPGRAELAGDGELPELDELDYAVLRTQEAVGHRSASGPDDAPRGWLGTPPVPHVFDHREMLLIAQHALGGPLMVSLGAAESPPLNANETRVQYSVETAPGSSGGPVLDSGFDVVALHHARRPDGVAQGVPIAAIQQRLDAKGLGWVFESPPP